VRPNNIESKRDCDDLDKERARGLQTEILWQRICLALIFGLGIALLFAFSDFPGLYPFAISIIVLCGIGFPLTWIKANNDRNRRHEFLWATIAVLFVLVMLLLLLKARAFGEPSEFLKAKFEWFIGLSFALGLAGATWAFLAKIQADKAFHKAQEAALNAENAHRAIAGIVHFEELLLPAGMKAKVPMLPELLASAHDKLIMVLGVPAVGFFRKPMRKLSMAFCHDLIKKLDSLPASCKIRLIYFSPDKLKDLLDKSDVNDGERKEFDEIMALLSTTVTNRSNTAPENCKKAVYSLDFGLRFIIAISESKERIREECAVVWVVSELDEIPAEFKSGGFTTRDRTIIENLEFLADDLIKRLNLPSGTPETPPAGGATGKK